MPKTVFLFDMDGVLIHAQGYKEALRATVGYFAAQFGHPDFHLGYEVIADFEALGITNEWESAPFCIANFLGMRETISASHVIPFAERMAEALRLDETRVSHRFLRYFKGQMSPDLHAKLEKFLGDVYSMQTPSTAIFQAHTLGKEKFITTYGYEPHLTRESYLLQYDRPLLDAEYRAKLKAWSAQNGNGFALFTARPSLPPRDSGAEVLSYAPEADLAAELLNLSDHPIIAAGRLRWLATQRGTDEGGYVKPSPVHALAGLGAALTHQETASLHAAVRLVEEGQLEAPLADLQGDAVHLVVFEDSKGGIISTQRATELLNQAGISATYETIGIATETSKRTALETMGARVFPDVHQGLAWFWGR